MLTKIAILWFIDKYELITSMLFLICVFSCIFLNNKLKDNWYKKLLYYTSILILILLLISPSQQILEKMITLIYNS